MRTVTAGILSKGVYEMTHCTETVTGFTCGEDLVIKAPYLPLLAKPHPIAFWQAVYLIENFKLQAVWAAC